MSLAAKYLSRGIIDHLLLYQPLAQPLYYLRKHINNQNRRAGQYQGTQAVRLVALLDVHAGALGHGPEETVVGLGDSNGPGSIGQYRKHSANTNL